MLPKLNGEQMRVLLSMNNYWNEISKRDEPRRSECAKEEISVMLTVLSPMDVLLIVGDYVTKKSME